MSWGMGGASRALLGCVWRKADPEACTIRA